MKNLFLGFLTIILVNSCFSQNGKYYNSEFEFKDRAELITLIDKIVNESDIAEFKDKIEYIQDISLTVRNGLLIFQPIDGSAAAINTESSSCPEGYTNHGTFRNADEIRNKVALIAAPIENCCPKVTIILDRGPLGVRICSKTE